MNFNRETAVGLLAAFLLTFTAWTWGGVVLWAQWVVAALGLLTLAVALFPPLSTAPDASAQGPSFSRRLLLAASGFGGVLGLVVGGHDLATLLANRSATLQLIPSAELPPLAFSDWGLRGLLGGIFSALVLLIVGGFIRTSDPRRRLLRFPFFWLGIFLFAWIACQSWNTWGIVVHRDLGWRILPSEHIGWLPSGLDAPFASDEEPGGMNGWRQLLILVGPWALLCALRAAVQRRRSYAWLAAVAIVNGLGVALAGNLARANKWKDFLGVTDPDLTNPPFGPFIYKNHAGAYLCLAAGLALALMYHLAKLRGDKADRGGPHLVVGLALIFLALGAASTMSFAAVAGAASVVLIVAPLAYLLDRKLRADFSPLPAVAFVALGAIVLYVGLLSADANQWRLKVMRKQQLADRVGLDDRAPLREATWLMVSTPSFDRQLSGWGGGSYRWVSPDFMRTQEVFLNKRGELVSRATHAHNDWLQAPVEWGLAGWTMVAGALAFLVLRLRAQVRGPSAPALALLGVLFLFSGHAFFDFLTFIPQLTLLAVMTAWLLVIEENDGVAGKSWEGLERAGNGRGG